MLANVTEQFVLIIQNTTTKSHHFSVWQVAICSRSYVWHELQYHFISTEHNISFFYSPPRSPSLLSPLSLPSLSPLSPLSLPSLSPLSPLSYLFCIANIWKVDLRIAWLFANTTRTSFSQSLIFLHSSASTSRRVLADSRSWEDSSKAPARGCEIKGDTRVREERGERWRCVPICSRNSSGSFSAWRRLLDVSTCAYFNLHLGASVFLLGLQGFASLYF